MSLILTVDFIFQIYYWNTTAPFRPVITRGLKKKRRRRRSIETSVPTAEKPHMVEYLVGTELRMSQNISGLVPSLRYHAYVTAFNTGGEGPKSGVLVFETRATSKLINWQFLLPLQATAIDLCHYQVFKLGFTPQSQVRQPLFYTTMISQQRNLTMYPIRGSTTVQH